MSHAYVLTLILFISVINVTYSSSPSTKTKTHPLHGLTIYQLISVQGYTYENHTVETEDGYLLEMHRIPAGKSGKAATRGPVLIFHGFLSCSADFVINPLNQSLGLLLADAGFDVWLGNARGNTFSRNHKSLDANSDPKFWDFTWHDIGHDDVPAMIDHILEISNQTQLQYIGYSQGTTSFYVMASERHEYLEKVKLMIGLAPASNFTYQKNPILKYGARFHKSIWSILTNAGLHELFSHSPIITNIAKEFCSEGKPTQELCRDILFILGGYSPEQTDPNFLPVIGSNTPAGVSAKQLIHFLQCINNEGILRQFDYYDENKNMEKYGSLKPPKYNIDHVETPTAIFFSTNDYLASDEDAKNLSNELRNVVFLKQIPDKYWNHLDFIYGIDAKKLVYDDVLKLLLKYQ